VSVLELRGLSVAYRSAAGPVPAVRGIDLAVERGEVVGLVGESGCGKSTVATAILRLLPRGTKVTGEVLLDGVDLLKLSPARIRAVRWAGASMIFQGALHALNPVQRIGDQIAEAILVHEPVARRAALGRAAELLEQVGLPGRRATDYPHELSGGQKQRVMVAMALACRPSLVIADEPTTALDVIVQAQVLALLARLQRELGLAMLFITHDLAVLGEVSDRLAVMYAGEIVEEGAARAVLDAPTHPYTVALASAFPRIGDPASRRAPSGLPGDPPDPRELPAGCVFAPRCPSVFDRCASERPALLPVGEGRRAACLLHAGGAA
jgi:peptide/nickel transport system ATP-binding protein